MPLLIDIENSIKAAQSRGYEQWAKIHNLKQAAKTYNFLTTHGIEQYGDLTAKIAEVQADERAVLRSIPLRRDSMTSPAGEKTGTGPSRAAPLPLRHQRRRERIS